MASEGHVSMLKNQCSAELNLFCESDGCLPINSRASGHLQFSAVHGDDSQRIIHTPTGRIETCACILLIHQRPVPAREGNLREVKLERQVIANKIILDVSLWLDDSENRKIIDQAVRRLEGEAFGREASTQALKVVDPPQVQPRCWGRIEGKRSVFARIEDGGSPGRPIYRGEIRSDSPCTRNH